MRCVCANVPPEVYKLVRWVVRLARYLYAKCGSGLPNHLCKQTHDLSLGLRYGEVKRHAHNHAHPHQLLQLLGGLREHPGIVSVKHSPKRRRQDWLSGSYFPPPPRIRLSPQVHQSVHDVLSALKRV